MKTKYISDKKFIIVGGLLVLGALYLGNLTEIIDFLKGPYVTSNGSEFCYETESEHGNMEEQNKIYFETLEECGKQYHE